MSLCSDNYLKSLRIAKGYGIHDMAEAMNMEDGEYRKLEMSGTEKITLGNCDSLVKNLKINPLEIIALFS